MAIGKYRLAMILMHMDIVQLFTIIASATHYFSWRVQLVVSIKQVLQL